MDIYCNVCKVNVEEAEWNNHLDSDKPKNQEKMLGQYELVVFVPL